MWRDEALLLDMLLAARKALRFTQDFDAPRFAADELVQNAVMHVIQIIGEAAFKISAEFKTAHPEIPWSAIVGMRHRLVHDYTAHRHSHGVASGAGPLARVGPAVGTAGSARGDGDAVSRRHPLFEHSLGAAPPTQHPSVVYSNPELAPETTLILLPGLHGTNDLFGPLRAVIPPGFRTRVVSYPCDQALSYDALLELIERELRPEREMVLVAESFSGPLAIRFAAANPARVRALVLAASFIRSPVPRWLRGLVHPLLFKVPPPAAALKLLLLARSASLPLAREVRTVVRRVSPHVLAHRLREVFALDCSAELKECPVPILYLAAASDRLVRRSSLSAILAIRSDIQVRTLAGAHMLLQANPSAAWREIEDFLSRMVRTSP